MRTPRTKMARRAFSLIELLTVIGIIALVIAIIIPALGGARNAAKRTASQQLMTEINNACARYKSDHQGRNPGYFPERAMGSSDNRDRGLSGMENAMLDLAGEGAILGSAQGTRVDASQGDIIVGPTNVTRDQIVVRSSLMATSDSSYFKPSGDFYEAQLSSTGQQVGAPAHAGASATDPQMLDVIDSFGNPILFWSADTYSMPRPGSIDEFVSINGNQSAMFYWNSNAAFLRATALGRKGFDQTLAPVAGRATSLIGAGMLGDETELKLSMGAVLGNVSAPRAVGMTADEALAAGNLEALYPGLPRGGFVLQSAGPDGIFVSSNDKGFKGVAHETNHIDYGLSFFATESTRLTDDDGNPTSRDVLADFDDVVTAGGG